MKREEGQLCLEFKTPDGAWHEVSLKFEEHKLIIHSEDRVEGGDEELSLENVKNLEELKAKFRLPSRRLQDKHCKKAMPGMIVCALHDQDDRYFDARVINVAWSKHMFVDHEEQCMCTYEVLWLAGPYEGEKITIHCENICLLRFGSIRCHPVIKEVVKYLQDKKKYKSQSTIESSFPIMKVKLEEKISEDRNLIDLEKGLGKLSSAQGASENENLCNMKNESSNKIGFCNRSRVEWTQKGYFKDYLECEAKVCDKYFDARQGGDNNSSEHCKPLSNFVHKPSITEVGYINGSGPKSSALKEMEQTEDSVDHKLKTVNLPREENFLQQSFSNDNNLRNIIQNIPHSISERNVSNEADADNNLCSSKQGNMDSGAVTCKTEGCESGEGPLACINFGIEDAIDEGLLKKDSDCSGGWLDADSPRTEEDCKGKIVGNSDNDFDYHLADFFDAEHASCVNGHRKNKKDHLERLDNIKEAPSIAVIDDDREAMRCTENATGKVKLLDAAQNEGIMNACTVYSSSKRRQPEVMHKENALTGSYITHCGQNIECKQDLDHFASFTSDDLTTPCLRAGKGRELLSSDIHDHVDVTSYRGEKSGTGVHICIPSSIWYPPRKRPRCNTNLTVEALQEVNFSCEKEKGTGGKNDSVNKQNSDICRSCKMYGSDVLQLSRVPCPTVETDNVKVDNKQWKPTPKACCGCKEDFPKNHPSKNTALEDLPLTRCQETHHSASGLYNSSVNLLPLSQYSAALGKLSFQASCYNGNICHCHLHNKNCPSSSHLYLLNCNNSNMVGLPQKERECRRLPCEYCAKCGVFLCINDNTDLSTCVCGCIDDACYYNQQSMSTGCCPVCHKKVMTNAFDCIGGDNCCLLSLKGKSTICKEQNELIRTGNFNLSSDQSFELNKKVCFGDTAVDIDEGKYCSMQRTIGGMTLDAVCGPPKKEEPKDQHKLFSSSHVLVLENLEKNVMPQDVLSVIHHAGGKFVKVYIFPSNSFEKFTRGLVCFEDQADFWTVSAFLRNGNILIASSTGRPWVVIDAENGLSEGSFGGFTTDSEQCCGSVPYDKIQILNRGTPEYERAERLRSNFLEWWQHLKLLHRSLAYAETIA